MSQDERYKQLALFSVILAEVVVNPLVLGAVFYFGFSASTYRWLLGAAGALIGLALAFYRIARTLKNGRGASPDGK